MDRLKEYYDENEDFGEIDALLAAWSCQEADAPEDLHQKIMSALPQTPKKAKRAKKYIPYLATAALAAVVIMASLSLLQPGGEEQTTEKMRSNDVALFNQAAMEDTEDTADAVSAEKGLANSTLAVQPANMDIAMEDMAIDWQKEKEEKEEMLSAQQELLAQAEDKEKAEAIIAWLEECLSAIEQEDSEKYEELLKNSPLNE